MLTKKQFLVLTALALLSLILVIVNAILVSQSQTRQTELNGRQQFIQQSIQLEGLYQQMIKALAELSAKNNDQQLRTLLNDQGITFSANPAPAPDSAAPKK